jgi:hypothetical protein
MIALKAPDTIMKRRDPGMTKRCLAAMAVSVYRIIVGQTLFCNLPPYFLSAPGTAPAPGGVDILMDNPFVSV